MKKILLPVEKSEEQLLSEVYEKAWDIALKVDECYGKAMKQAKEKIKVDFMGACYPPLDGNLFRAGTELDVAYLGTYDDQISPSTHKARITQQYVNDEIITRIKFSKPKNIPDIVIPQKASKKDISNLIFEAVTK